MCDDVSCHVGRCRNVCGPQQLSGTREEQRRKLTVSFDPSFPISSCQFPSGNPLLPQRGGCVKQPSRRAGVVGVGGWWGCW